MSSTVGVGHAPGGGYGGLGPSSLGSCLHESRLDALPAAKAPASSSSSPLFMSFFFFFLILFSVIIYYIGLSIFNIIFLYHF